MALDIRNKQEIKTTCELQNVVETISIKSGKLLRPLFQLQPARSLLFIKAVTLRG